jgi:2',3'-cyclic-nucleotide 2'-phosphodiesterase
MRIAFLGDINGAPGRQVLMQQLPVLRERFRPDCVIVNVENAKAGSGVTPEQFQQFRGLGVDGCTLGDHVFRESRIIPFLESPAEPISRPANLSRKAPGKRLLRIPQGGSRTRDVWVITVLGRVFMPLPADDPFAAVDELLSQIPDRDPIVIVEAHMEATSEKIALGHYLDGRVTAVLGTHTHVPTADERLLRRGTAFQTDLGMCGPYDSVIGRDTELVVKAMTTSLHVAYTMGEGGEALAGAILEVDDGSGRAKGIERVFLPADRSQAPFR